MSRTKNRLVALLVTPPACFLAYHLGTTLANSHSAPPILTNTRANGALAGGLEASHLDFGEVWEDPEFVHTMMLNNRTGAVVRVQRLVGGCECTTIEPQDFAVAPGGSQQVQVRIDLTHRYPQHFGLDRRELAVSVHPVIVGRGLAAEGWTVRGVVKSRVSLEARELAFGDLCGQSEAVARTMKATAHIPLARLEASCPEDKGRVSVVPAPKRPGGYDIRITPNADLPLGPFHFQVALTATTPDGVKHRCVAFRVYGEVRSPVRIITEPVLLGEHPVGSAAEATVSVRFPGSGWSVDRIETEQSETRVQPTDPLDGRPTYCISQPISKPGDGTCQVRFVCRRPDGQLETVPASVRWYGEQPSREKQP